MAVAGMTNRLPTVMGIMDSLTPKQPGSGRPDAAHLRLVESSRDVGANVVSTTLADASLGGLFRAMQSGSDSERERGWEEVYKRCWQMVWTRVFYVMRTIQWAGEP